MATAFQPSSLQMRSADLIRKEPLDYGGFGEVYLCYHITLGHVVLKTMYTGPLRNEERKKSLLEEGSIMASLNHERVVKLLGVIMEDKDCSLVIELLPRGNLLTMLETVSGLEITVPVSIKGRIILEILEGMMYLTKRHVIHKDIKPENILVDKDFHIKIADLGLATCQTWSKLTQQESRRKSRSHSSGTRGAGTLSYMAPEHLESIHTASTEKSDVYSFAIVVWVILTGEEPYRNARSEDHISQCVRNGDRPAEDLIPKDTPEVIIDLMKTCWAHDPQQRPTYEECYKNFLPFYKEVLESHVEEDLLTLRDLYEGPEDLIEKMKTLSVTQQDLSESEQDSPAPLRSSDRGAAMPVEASIEDLNGIPFDWIQSDSKPPSSPLALEDKLSRELQYHKHGSYNNNSYNTTHTHMVLPNQSRPPGHTRQPQQDKSSVQSWTRAEPVQPSSLHGASYCHTSDSLNSIPISSHLTTSFSNPSLSQHHSHSPLDRQQSLPTFPACDISGPDVSPWRPLALSKCGLPQDKGSLYIQNASAIQVGSNNIMNIPSLEPSLWSTNSPIKSATSKFEDHAVTEKHLELLRDNIGLKWKRCARCLGLTSVEIETIEHDYYRDGLPEIVHQMLERWKMKEGSFGCTIGKLCRALEGNIKVEVVQKILDSCGSP